MSIFSKFNKSENSDKLYEESQINRDNEQLDSQKIFELFNLPSKSTNKPIPDISFKNPKDTITKSGTTEEILFNTESTKLYYIAFDIGLIKQSRYFIDNIDNIDKIINLGKNVIVKLIVFSDKFRISEYLYLEKANIKEQIITFLFNCLKDNTLNCENGINGVLAKIDEDINSLREKNMSLEKFNKIYQINEVYVTLCGNTSSQILDNSSLVISNINKLAITSYYMTQDETVKLSSLGFRNLYFVNR